MKNRADPICFVLPEITGGGVATQVQKWIRALAATDISCSVVLLRDKSSLYTPKLSHADFPVPVHTVAYDSRDKASVYAREFASNDVFRASRALVCSKITTGGVIASFLRDRSWKGVFIETVPAEDEVTLSSLAESLAYCDSAVVMSSSLAETLTTRLGIDPSRVVIAAGGAESQPIDFGHRHLETRPLRVCYIGRFDAYHKRIFDLPKIASKVEESGIRCNWTIAGGKSPNLEKAFEHIPNVKFPGSGPRDEVREFLLNHDVFVLPSLFEGLSNAMCEAAEAACVPLVTRVSGSTDVVDDGVSGFLLKVGDVDGFAERIIQLNNNRTLLEKMSRAIRETAVSRFSSTHFASKIHQAIEECESQSRDYQALRPSSHFLESNLVPNFVTRNLRRFWRAFRGRPRDAVRSHPYYSQEIR